MALYRHTSFPGLLMQIDPELRIIEDILRFPSNSVDAYAIKLAWDNKSYGAWGRRSAGEPINEVAFNMYFYRADSNGSV